ncbi:uncharacterized protein LOC130737585 isoform X2 [Lotus japonicus]|uniref:uncharacterized protein LOC130737585 isoform X2 n=1 Tax=Lotus japonicus TaxID=34305 RepID=UPI0025871D6B|nr:uncharacterized protein LOC130737585 isoform X2 [Lotus japonicus]
MDPNDILDFDAFYEEMVEDYMNDTSAEDYLRMVQESQQQSDDTVRRRRKVIERSREEGHNRLFNDYFSETPVFTETKFRRRFRMRRELFLRIVEALGNHDNYFQMRVDTIRKKGLSPLQKCTAAIRMLAYGSPADNLDEYVRIGESTAIECLERFVTGVNEIFGAQYLRRPNKEDTTRLLQMGESRGFPAPEVHYEVNRTQYHMGYYLADGIYPEWATFVKTIPMPQGEKRQLFAKAQEGARKCKTQVFKLMLSE